MSATVPTRPAPTAVPAQSDSRACRYRSKSVAAWAAVVGGSLGLHRFYLRGLNDGWGWLHALPTLAGLWGVWRVQQYGQDDMLSWLLIPLLGVMVAQGMLCGIVFGLAPDERWDARHNPSLGGRSTRWAPVLAAIVGLMVGAGVLMATIAFSGQRFFEWQVEEARQISQ